MKEGEGEGEGEVEGRGRKITLPPHPRLLVPFFARSLIFSPKPHGNACYAD